MSALLLSLVLAAQVSDTETLSAQQFLRLMKGLHSEIQDVTFVYEGIGELLNDQSHENEGGYQGLYSFRSDGATLLDIFNRSLRDDKPGYRFIHAILNGKMEGVTQIPDLGFLKPETTKALPGVLNKPTSPERIVYLWYFQTLDDPARFGYQFQGWEDCDGHRCLKVQLYDVPEAGLENVEKKPTVKFWIDVGRGGHPLKVEYFAGPEINMRTEKIQLSQVPFAGGKSIWFPVRGETGSYYGGAKTVERSSSPVSRETYAVVDGSIRFNQGLKNSYFTLDKNRSLPEIAGLRALQQRLNHVPPLRTDPAGVKERLDKMLVEADQQAKQLEASSAARETWETGTAAQVGLIAFGVCSLGAAVFWWRRSR